MSHQALCFPSNSRLNRSSSGSSLPLCSPYSRDRRAQQALYIGCPDTNMVSFSPPVENSRQMTHPSNSSLISPYHMPSPSSTLNATPRIMYPSSSYLHGNPGFYYDLVQNSTHTGYRRTTLHPLPTDYVYTLTYFPTPLRTLLFQINCSVLYGKLLVLCSLDWSSTI
jgi:hypothetical protein